MPRVDSVSREALLFESVSPVFAMLDSTDPALRSDFQESEATPEGLLFDDVVGVIPIPAPRTSGR